MHLNSRKKGPLSRLACAFVAMLVLGALALFFAQAITLSESPVPVALLQDKKVYLPVMLSSWTGQGPTATPTQTPSPTATQTMPWTPTPTASLTPTTEPTATSTPPLVGWFTILEETFEGVFPGTTWTLVDEGTGAAEYFWGKRDCRPHTGSYSGWAVGGGANGSLLACGSNYPDGRISRMAFGPFNLEDATDGELRFYVWLNTEYQPDALWYLLSFDGQNFHDFGGDTGNTGGWVERVFSLRDLPGLGDVLGRPQVWIAFEFESDSDTNFPEGVYVDDIVLRKYVSVIR